MNIFSNFSVKAYPNHDDLYEGAFLPFHLRGVPDIPDTIFEYPDFHENNESLIL